MKAVVFSRHGAPEDVCECVEVPDPGEPGDGEIVVAVAAAPINPADLLMLQGTYPGPAVLPAGAGIEGAGKVAAAGPGVTRMAPGDNVIVLTRANWAQRVRIKQTEAIRLPADLDVVQAAMLKANPATAHLMLRDYVELGEGDWLIQNAANSAVGRHVIRLARRKGVRTANVVRRAPLVAALKDFGADVVIVDGDDLAARVRSETGNAAIPLALDAIGGRATTRLADCLADGGTVVNYGFLAGEPCMITPHQTILHGITLKGFWLAGLFRTARLEDLEALYGELSGLVADGTLEVPVEASYDLADIKKAVAHAGLEGRNGKILLTPNGPAG